MHTLNKKSNQPIFELRPSLCKVLVPTSTLPCRLIGVPKLAQRSEYQCEWMSLSLHTNVAGLGCSSSPDSALDVVFKMNEFIYVVASFSHTDAETQLVLTTASV